MEYWTSGVYAKVSFCESNGRYLPVNVSSGTYNVVDNQRLTIGQPDHYDHTIYVIGTCIARGYGVSDEWTIPSILQKKLSHEGYDKYIVRNFGTRGGLNAYSDIRDFVNISRIDIRAGDIVIHLGYNCWELEKSKVEFEEYYELSWLFNRKYERRCFINAAPHLTAYANEVVAEYIYGNIKKELSVL